MREGTVIQGGLLRGVTFLIVPEERCREGRTGMGRRNTGERLMITEEF